VKPEDCLEEDRLHKKRDDEVIKDQLGIEKPKGPTEKTTDSTEKTPNTEEEPSKEEPEKGKLKPTEPTAAGSKDPEPKEAESLTNQQAQQPAPAQPTQPQPLEEQAKRPLPNRPLLFGNGGSQGRGRISYHGSESWRLDESVP
jgi:hypothetical protein